MQKKASRDTIFLGKDYGKSEKHENDTDGTERKMIQDFIQMFFKSFSCLDHSNALKLNKYDKQGNSKRMKNKPNKKGDECGKKMVHGSKHGTNTRLMPTVDFAVNVSFDDLKNKSKCIGNETIERTHWDPQK